MKGITLNNIEKALELTSTFDALREKMETFFQPHIEAWIQTQVALNRMDKKDAEQEFVYSETTETSVIFESEDWEETWRYGGYEKHYGRSISIPLAFIDNPEQFLKDAKETQASAARQQEIQRLASQQQEIQRLQRQLEIAESNFKAGTK